MFSSCFMLFPTFLESNSVGGRSRATCLVYNEITIVLYLYKYICLRHADILSHEEGVGVGVGGGGGC